MPGERAGIFGIHQPDILISDYLVRIRRDVRYLPLDSLEIGGEQCALIHHALEFEQLDISPERGTSRFIMGFFEARKYSLALPHASLFDADFVLIRYKIDIERGERVDIFRVCECKICAVGRDERFFVLFSKGMILNHMISAIR